MSNGGGEDAVLLSMLMCVRRKWTDIALYTPELWAHTTIDSRPRSLAGARRKLSRSKAVPLDIGDHIAINFGPGSQPPLRSLKADVEVNRALMALMRALGG